MTTSITYDDKSVRRFMIASIAWGIIGMLVGVIIATQLSFWQLNGKFLESLTGGWIKGDGISFLTFGRTCHGERRVNCYVRPTARH